MKSLIRVSKRYLGRGRLRLRLFLFENNRELATNILYEAYHFKAKRFWKKAKGTHPAHYAEKAEAFARDGYYVIPPVRDRVLLQALCKKVDSLFDRSELCLNLSPGLLRLKDGYELLPEVESFLTAEIAAIIEHYFQSYFKIYSVNVYRIVPEVNEPKQSFLWHLDNCPRSVIKLMVYLDDTTEETGAFRLKPRALSEVLLRQGFWERARNDEFASTLEDHSSTRVIEGPVGTCILFQDGRCVHKATFPRGGHRDVVTFVMQPSDIPWQAHLGKNRHRMSLNEGFCLNPFTDRPQATGEYH